MPWTERHRRAVARRRPARRLPALLTALSLTAAGLTVLTTTTVGSPAPAAAATVSTLASTRYLPTAQINGVVWNQIVVGNRVFAAGEFTKARPAGAAAGTQEVSRSNLLSYNLTTGVLDSFAPAVNGTIHNLAASPDQKTLYIVGNFTKVGSSTRQRIAAFTVATGALTSFAPTLSSRAFTVLPTSKGVFVGGEFTAANGVARSRTAAFTPQGGLLKWAPTVEGGSVRDMVTTPAQGGIVLGGNFIKVDGTTKGMGLALVGSSVGNVVYPMPINDIVRNGSSKESGIWDLGSDANGFYATGWGTAATLEGVARADWTGKLIWVEDCHGDSYSAYPSKDYLYVAGHSHYCANVGGAGDPTPRVYHRGLAFSVGATGQVSPDPTQYKNWAGRPRPTPELFYPDFDAGVYTGQSQGPWSVTGAGNYVAYAGEFTTVNGKAQQGLVRFATRAAVKATDGPQLPTGFAPRVIGYAGGQARVRWPAVRDRDNLTLTFELLKNGTVIARQGGLGHYWIQPSYGVLDTGLTSGQPVKYQVKVTDPDGNVATSAETSYTYSAGQSLATYQQEVLADNPDTYWTGTAANSTSAVQDLAAGADHQGEPAGTSDGVLGGGSRSFRFDGGETVSTSNLELAPNTMSVEAWFKTTSTNGGAVITSSSSQSGNSALTDAAASDIRADRAVFLDPEGRVNFGIWARQGYVNRSAQSYNDGNWHHVVATLAYNGSRLYVDGALVASQSVVFGGNNKMAYWRMGGDLLAGYPNNPTAADPSRVGYLSGDIDQVAIYQRALSASRVSAHFNAGP